MKKSLTSCSLLLALSFTAWGAQKPKNDQSELQKEAKITMAQAQKIALDTEPGTIKSREIERENGKLIFSFDIQTKKGIHEINVDAITGQVVENSVESKAAEKMEKQQEKGR